VPIQADERDENYNFDATFFTQSPGGGIYVMVSLSSGVSFESFDWFLSLNSDNLLLHLPPMLGLD